MGLDSDRYVDRADDDPSDSRMPERGDVMFKKRRQLELVKKKAQKKILEKIVLCNKEYPSYYFDKYMEVCSRIAVLEEILKDKG